MGLYFMQQKNTKHVLETLDIVLSTLTLHALTSVHDMVGALLLSTPSLILNTISLYNIYIILCWQRINHGTTLYERKFTWLPRNTTKKYYNDVCLLFSVSFFQKDSLLLKLRKYHALVSSLSGHLLQNSRCFQSLATFCHETSMFMVLTQFALIVNFSMLWTSLKQTFFVVS